jgi:RNA-binding protein
MNPPRPLTGAQKSQLRALGQKMPDAIALGRSGPTPEFAAEISRLLHARELVKLRFTGSQERAARAELCRQIETIGDCTCVGAVGHTALFWREPAAGSALL